MPCILDDVDNAFLHKLSAKSDELLESIVCSAFRSFPCDVRVQCSESAVQCVDDIIGMVHTLRCQLEERGFGGCIARVTLYADQLHEQGLCEYDEWCSFLLTFSGGCAKTYITERVGSWWPLQAKAKRSHITHIGCALH